MLGIMESFWKLETANDSQILAVKARNPNQQDLILGCLLAETNKLRPEPGLKKPNHAFKIFGSRFEKCPLVPGSAMDTSNFPPLSESLQGCEWWLIQLSSLVGSNQTHWFKTDN